MFGHFWSKMDRFWRLPAMDLWLNGPKMAWILDLTWVKYIQVEWAPFLGITASLTVKSLKIMPKMAQTMAIFRHKWLIKWPKKIILINIQLLMSSGQLLIPIKYLEVPFAPACFIVWPALWNRPAPLRKNTKQHKYATNSSSATEIDLIYSSWKIYLSYEINTLGPLCLWQCFWISHCEMM